MKIIMKILFAALITVVLLSSCGGGGGDAAPSVTPPPVVVENRIMFEIELVEVMVRRPSDDVVVAVDVSAIPRVELTLID